MSNLIENGRKAQAKFINLNDDEMYNEFADHKLNPIYKECFEEMIGNCDWLKISHNLQLMFFASLKIDGKSTRIFFKQELDGMSQEEIEEILNGDFINKDFVQSYYDRYYVEKKGTALYHVKLKMKVGEFSSVEEAKEESKNVDGVYKFMSERPVMWKVENGVVS